MISCPYKHSLHGSNLLRPLLFKTYKQLNRRTLGRFLLIFKDPICYETFTHPAPLKFAYSTLFNLVNSSHDHLPKKNLQRHPMIKLFVNSCSRIWLNIQLRRVILLPFVSSVILSLTLFSSASANLPNLGDPTRQF